MTLVLDQTQPQDGGERAETSAVCPTLAGMNRARLAEALAAVGVSEKQLRMRTTQLWRWLYVTGATSFDQMTDVSKDLRETNDKIGEYVERKVTAEDQLKRTDIRAPQDGMVLQSQVHTVGGVITAGDAIMTIVPQTDDLRVEAKVNPQDIDKLQIGQKTLLRLSAFNQRTTPELNGVVTRVSPDVTTDQFHIDILTAHFVRNPHWFDVVVGSNLFGDILSDLGPAVVGSIGIAPSGNINPERKHPSMFEPVHGSAPDIAGKGIANPIGQVWSGAMMLEHLGHKEAADAVVRAIAIVLAGGGPKTPDLGGNGGTRDITRAIVEAVKTA